MQRQEFDKVSFHDGTFSNSQCSRRAETMDPGEQCISSFATATALW